MSTLFSDNFNIADTSSLGVNYTESIGDSSIVSNKVRIGGVSSSINPGILLTTTNAHPDTANVAVSVTQVNTSGDGGPIARCTEADATPVMYAIDSFSSEVDIHRFDNAAAGTLLRTSSITRVANAVLRLEVTGTGATVTLKQFYNGVQQGADVNDGSVNRITAAGRTGISSWPDPGSTTTARDYDDFLVEDFVTAGIISAIRVGHFIKRQRFAALMD